MRHTIPGCVDRQEASALANERSTCVYTRRTSGRNCDHWHFGGFVAAGDSGSARSGAADTMQKSAQANWLGHSSPRSTPTACFPLAEQGLTCTLQNYVCRRQALWSRQTRTQLDLPNPALPRGRRNPRDYDAGSVAGCRRCRSTCVPRDAPWPPAQAPTAVATTFSSQSTTPRLNRAPTSVRPAARAVATPDPSVQSAGLGTSCQDRLHDKPTVVLGRQERGCRGHHRPWTTKSMTA